MLNLADGVFAKVGDHLVADIRKSYLRENEDAPIIRKVAPAKLVFNDPLDTIRAQLTPGLFLRPTDS